MFRRPLMFVTTALNVLGSFWVFALATVICIDILGRALFGKPLLGVPEFVQFSIAGIVYLQLGDATRSGRLIRSDAFIGRLHLRRPRALQWLLAVIDTIATILFAWLAVSMLPEIGDAWQQNYQIGTRGYFTLPAWPLKLTIALGAAIVALHTGFQAIWHIRVATGHEPVPDDPVAAPEL